MKNIEIHTVASEVSIEEAKARIKEIAQEVAQMGGNDSEFFKLRELETMLDGGQISPSDAVIEANKIKSGKEDYH